MKKMLIIFISIFLSTFSLISYASENKNSVDTQKTKVENLDISEKSNLFGSKNNQNNSQQSNILSENKLRETKGGARSYQYICTQCGAFHSGVYSPKVCYNCYNKGFR